MARLLGHQRGDRLLGNLGNGLQALLGPDIPGPLAARVRAEGEAVLAAAGISHTTPEEEAAERGDRVRHRPAGGFPRTELEKMVG